MTRFSATLVDPRDSGVTKTRSRSRCGPMMRALVLVWLAAVAHLGNAYKEDGAGCTFPSKWAGRWFQSGVIQQIVIADDRLSSKGKCFQSEGDKFLLLDEKGCYRCVVIHEKHINVLQYKETFCHTREAIPNLCSLITGDALLYSMFRENAPPVACPLKGPFSFTYNRGHGDCKYPVSSIESCTEESRLLLNYQACPDVYGSESTVEELECLGTWKEGSQRYLVGKVHHNHATSNEDRYRCFVYEKTNDFGPYIGLKEEVTDVDYDVAQSGDATCNGLASAKEGSRTMALTRVPLSWKCKFPTWMTFPGHWHTLDYSNTYSFHQKNATLRITNQTGIDIKVHCAHIKSSSISETSVTLIAHWLRNCLGRYVCLAFYRRGTHIAEMQIGKTTKRADEACSASHFDPSTIPFITLVTSNPEAKDCPYSGKFSIAGLKIHQRNARSLQAILSSDGVKNNHKHNYKKHKHLNENDDQKLTPVERRKRKYQKFLEKVFAKEAMKTMRLKKKEFLKPNSTEPQNSSEYESIILSNSTIETRTMNLESQTFRNRRSSENIDGSMCVDTEFTTLDIGCNTHENMEFHSSCDNKEFITAYSCHGSWFENGTSYLITTPLTRDSIGAKRFCFIYKETHDRMIHFTRSSVNCDRSLRPGIDGALVFNATNSGECKETSTASSICSNWWVLLDCLTIYLTLFISHSLILR